MKPRILKKHHTRYLAEFLVECSQNPQWSSKLQQLNDENKLDTAIDGFPAELIEDFPEIESLNLQYCIERVALEEVPRAAACWWPIEQDTHFYVAYPAAFPETSLYMAVDFDDHSGCCH
jgi:hypothetical protein